MRNFQQSRSLEFGQQPSRAIVPTRNCNNGRKHPQVGRGGNQRGRRGRVYGNRGRGNTKPGRKVAHVDGKTQCYAFPGKNVVEASDAVITCTILVCD